MNIEKHNKKRKMYLILIFIGILGGFDTLSLAVFSNTNVGTLIPGILGVLLIAFGCIKIKLNGKLIIRNGFMRKLFFAVISLFIVSFLLVEGVILINGRSQENVKADYLIILGGGIKGDKITLALKERLDKGIDYLVTYPDIKVIVSGGLGAEETITEAFAMERYLVEHGIDATRVIKEEKATSTMENFKFSKELISKTDKRENIRLMIVTNDFHMFRSKLLAKRNGFQAYGISSKTPLQVWLNCYIREFFALTKSYFLDK